MNLRTTRHKVMVVPRLALRLLGAGLLCQTMLSSTVVLGWIRERQRRTVHRLWSRRCARSASLCAPESPTSWLRSISRSASEGFSSVAASAVLALPPLALLTLAWTTGWNLSFHKAYEQSASGPLLGLAAMAWFGMVLAVLPMAQARLAVTGSGRAFFDLRTVFRLARRCWIGTALLAMAHLSLAVPIVAWQAAPALLGNAEWVESALENAGPGKVRMMLGLWSLLGTVGILLPAMLLLRGAAARLYARALRRAAVSGTVPTSSLHEEERRALEAMALSPPATIRSVASCRVRGVLRTLGDATFLLFHAAMGIAFLFQSLIGQFLNYRPLEGWLNSPLLLFPWLRDVPPF